ncbi:MAG: gliding motility-associated C-terminal domain-containing protein [Flavobacteriales bacterium]
MPIRNVLTPLAAFAACAAVAQSGARFVENRGQWPEAVTFHADLPGAAIWLERDAILIDRFDRDPIAHAHDPASAALKDPVVHHHALRLRFVGADTQGRPEGLGVQHGVYNYFQGNDPARWASGAHGFSAALQHGIHPGVDLRVRYALEGLEYDLLIAPGADASLIALRYEGADGLELKNGNLLVRTSLGTLTEHIPLAYQEEANGARHPIACTYALKDGVVRFVLGDRDPALPTVIDPTLAFSTYSGATTNNFGYSATYDRDGFLYGGSSSFGNGYPTTVGAYQTSWAGGDGQINIPGTDIAITKFDTTGSFLIWSTMLGGHGDDLPHSLIVDDNGELIVLGTSGSPDFPTTTNAYDRTFGGGTPYTPQNIGVSYPRGADMIVARLSADGGHLLGSTYLGGSLNDGHNSAAALKVNYADEMRGEVLLDRNGDVIVVSCTQSPDFPVTPGAPQTTYGGGSHDGVVVRMDPMLTTLKWSTFIGGSRADAAFSGELDPQGQLYICGGTASSDLPATSGAYASSFHGGQADAFAARYAIGGSAVEALTYFGSVNYDQAYLLDLDDGGNVFLFGQTLAPANELILNAPYNTPGAGQFIAKFSPDLGGLLLSSRFGVGDGALHISPTAFLVDYCDKLYVSGWGSNIGIGPALTTTGMPITPNAYQSTTDGNDFYLAVFEVDMSSLYYATFFGGNRSEEHVDGGTSRFDRRGRVYEAVCAGCGGNSDLPTTPQAWSATNNSSCNLGVFKFDFEAPLVIAHPMAPPLACAGADVQFQNRSTLGRTYHWDFGDRTSSTEAEPTHTYAQPGTYTVVLTASNPDACNQQDTDSMTVTVRPAAPRLEAAAGQMLCGPTAIALLSCTSFGTATSFIWSTNASFSDTLNASLADSTATLRPPVPGTYYVQAFTPGSCTATDQLTISASLVNARLVHDASICAGGIATISVVGADAGSTFLWSPADPIITGQGTAHVTLSPSASMTMQVHVVSPTGCAWDTLADVLVSGVNAADVHATVDQPIVVPGTTVHLHATPASGVTYSWTPAAAVSDPSASNPTAFVTGTTTFVVTVTDGVCTHADSVKVDVYEVNCDEPDIFVPDAFTPNGDGNNDVLRVRGRAITDLDFKVFDRWGEEVFSTTDITKGWDGTFKGKAVDPAVYVYWLKAKCLEGRSFFKKGNVTVIR